MTSIWLLCDSKGEDQTGFVFTSKTSAEEHDANCAGLVSDWTRLTPVECVPKPTWLPITELGRFKRRGQMVVVHPRCEVWGWTVAGWFSPDGHLRDPSLYPTARIFPLPEVE